MSERRRIAVTGQAVVTPLADDPAELHRELCRGRSALSPVELFPVDELRTRLGGEVRNFAPQRYLEGVNLRPLDRTAQLAAVAAELALTTSGWTAGLRREHEVGLVLGTMFGSVHTISTFDRRALTAGPIYAKPLDFANSVINAAAGQTAILHGLRGVNSTVAGGPTAGLQALAYATERLRRGRAEALLAGGAEELCFESFAGFERAGLLAQSGNGVPPCAVPFDERRSGLLLSEGAGLLMLEELEAARSRGSEVLAEVRGHGSAFDSSRGADEARAVAAVARAIRQALDDAGLEAVDVEALVVSANGLPQGDRHEARGLRAVFGSRLDELPVAAPKGALGEALGASGAFQAVVAVQALRTGVLPGIVGLERSDRELELPGLSPEPREAAIRQVAVTAVGLDGQVEALVLAGSGGRP